MPAIVTLATLAVGLNIGLFMTVDGHLRSLSAKEMQVAQRENDLASAEARRVSLNSQIADLEERRRKAGNEMEEAEKRSADAQARKRDRDQIVNEVANLTLQNAKLNADLKGLNAQITQARADETKAKNDAKDAVALREKDIAAAHRHNIEATRLAREQEALQDRSRRDADAAQKSASEVTRLKTERDALVRDVENARQELNERRKERDLLNSQIAGYNNEGKLLQQRETSFRDQIKNLDGQVSVRTRDLNELEKRIAIASQQTRDAEKAVADLQRINSARDAASRELQKAQNDITIWNSEFSKRTAAISSLKEEESAALQRRATLDTTIKRQETTLNEASQQAAAKGAELNLISADLKTARADLALTQSMRRLINLTEADIQKISIAKTELENELAKRNADLTDVKRRVDDANAALKAVDAPTKIQSDSSAE